MTQLALTIARRARLAGQMKQGVAIIPTATELARNADSNFPFRFDSSFFYLTAFPEPDAIVVIVAGPQPMSILFCREKDPEREIWDGYRYGPEAAKAKFGFDEAWPLAEMDQRIPEILHHQSCLYSAFGVDASWDQRVSGWLQATRRLSVRAHVGPTELRDWRTLVDEMRLIKDEQELGVMRRAAAISGDAHVRAMRFAKPGCFEYEVEAELMHEFYRRGSRAPAYGSIVAAGANACVLHYETNNAVLNDGDLLLIDAGCELEGYASDITRTFPVNGKFSGPQRDVYEIVLAAQQAAIDLIRPGALWSDPHLAAVKVLAQGMLDLKWLEGSLDAVIESEAYRQFYMHQTGHWLGLDVHDVGDYKQQDSWRALQPGMVMTVEPGLYVRPTDKVPEAFWHIGIRIEDDVAITTTGHDVLTAGTPKTIADIEATMATR
ncbi:Xaa-Pro aminopeptidase [Chitinivorax tropicus]|uniref:Xaa-Pro aminopeptidase n=1 Tax=Chitinivorax tropicus TaxID=714531 RepID=A0A840MS44_9PROT|nr:Xaa-Pro aminopeptidase [Chitinivorax tropicus]MBB5019236.1 Xaa-Pro aminopeptidase [Chitinivorax tropicus]